MKKYNGKYRIESNRLPGWDYSRNGYYYITVVSYDRKCIFGKIQNNRMNFSDLGKIVIQEWHKSFRIRQELVLDEFILMPNHLHAIVILFDPDNRNNDFGNVDVRNVETDGRLSLRPDSYPDSKPNSNPHSDPNPDSDSDPNPNLNPYIPTRKPKSISSFIAGFKSAVVTKMDDHIDDQRLSIPKYNQKNRLWQANYHDHIIRDGGEYHRIKKYIINNPTNWDEDSFH